MANAFSKEERVAFEDILEGFQDALVLYGAGDANPFASYSDGLQKKRKT
jgi:hypothetical protein